MKRIYFLLSCVLLLAFSSKAQDSTAKKTNKEKVQNHVKNMDSTQKQKLKDKGITKENLKDLNLSNEQNKKVDDILVTHKKEKEKIQNDNSLTEDQKNEKLKALDKDAKKKINDVLTPEQKEKIKKHKEKTKSS